MNNKRNDKTRNNVWKFLSTVLLVIILLCGCSNNGKDSDTDKNNINKKTTIEDITGDWYGLTTYTNEEGGTVELKAVLSINPDGTWASSIDKYVHMGTWKSTSEEADQLELAVEQEGTDFTGTSSFRQKTGGKYFYDCFLTGVDPIEMTKMKDHPKGDAYGSWKNVTAHKNNQGASIDYDVSLAIRTDNTWSCSVNGNVNSGHWNYISEAGHLLILTVEDKEEGFTENWAFIKDIDKQYYFRYDYWRNIHFPMEKL